MQRVRKVSHWNRNCTKATETTTKRICNLRKHFTELTLSLFDQSYLDEIQDRWNRAKSKIFSKETLANKREKINATLTTEWQAARDIAQKSGVTYKATAKILYAMAKSGDIAIAEQEWVDERYRKRMRYLYRSNDHERDTALLLQNLLGFKAPADKTIFTGYVVRHLIEDAEQGKKTRVR